MTGKLDACRKLMVFKSDKFARNVAHASGWSCLKEKKNGSAIWALLFGR